MSPPVLASGEASEAENNEQANQGHRIGGR